MLFRSNDAVDGGDYVGEILGGITFTLQPQSQTVTIGSSLNWTSAGNLTVTDGWLTTIGNNAFAYALDKKWEMIDGFYGTGYYYGDLRYAAASTVGNLTTTNQTTFGGGNWTTAADVPTFATNGTTTVFHAGETLTIATTDNGATWSGIGINMPAGTRLLGGSPAGWVATTTAGGSVWQSTDLANWNNRTIGASANWSIASGGGTFLLASPAGQTARSTDGGITWSLGTAPNGIATLVYGGGNFLAVNGTHALRSSSGVSWTAVAMPAAANDYTRVQYTGGRFLAFRLASTTDVAVSTDGGN